MKPLSDPILLREYDTPQEACIVRGMLDANGVESEVTVNAIGTVFQAPDAGTPAAAIYVGASDYDRAVKLISEHGDR